MGIMSVDSTRKLPPKQGMDSAAGGKETQDKGDLGTRHDTVMVAPELKGLLNDNTLGHPISTVYKSYSVGPFLLTPFDACVLDTKPFNSVKHVIQHL